MIVNRKMNRNCVAGWGPVCCPMVNFKFYCRAYLRKDVFLPVKVHYAFHQYRMIGYRYLSDKNIPFKIYNKSSSKRKERSGPEHSERNVGYYEEKTFRHVFVVQYCSGGMQQSFRQ